MKMSNSTRPECFLCPIGTYSLEETKTRYASFCDDINRDGTAKWDEGLESAVEPQRGDIFGFVVKGVSMNLHVILDVRPPEERPAEWGDAPYHEWHLGGENSPNSQPQPTSGRKVLVLGEVIETDNWNDWKRDVRPVYQPNYYLGGTKRSRIPERVILHLQHLKRQFSVINLY
jgi:hypothetical protein